MAQASGAKKIGKLLFYALALLLALHVARLPFARSFGFPDFLALLAVAFLAAYLAIDALVKKKSRRRMAAVALVFAALSLLGSEIVLRAFFPRFRSYEELNGKSRYVKMFPDPAVPGKCPGPLSSRRMRCIRENKPDFSATYCFNNLGLRGRPLVPGEKSPGFRILALGDSFTEGVGADDQFTWPARLEALLRQHRRADSEVLNAGVSGSYPPCEAEVFAELEPLVHPDMVLLAVNMSDINDFILHSGYRSADGTFLPVSSRGPDWEWLYGTSYLFRALVHGLSSRNPLLQDRADESLQNQQAKACLERSIRDLAGACAKKGVAFAVFFHPAATEVLWKDEQFKEMAARLSADDIHAFDALGYFLSAAPLTEDGIFEYYWPNDLHHTPKGYSLLAEAVFYYLKSSDFFENSIQDADKNG